ncbi:hypothetical protein F2Q69_00059031 [Brassica cretica]|uniref:Uncharacterized protein n=1 Tax=Brassica cretica TaxID=69181 RepID=A0A8S9RJ74_BRACR|nr:hypothetical protein F2Q69_00059031 [Brassica cretica]
MLEGVNGGYVFPIEEFVVPRLPNVPTDPWEVCMPIFQGRSVIIVRNIKQVDPSHPVPYRSGFVFVRVTAGQARADCGPQNG